METNALRQDIELKPVSLEEREILNNLLEKYSYEFSQYNKRDVNKLGLYGYEYLDCYWWTGEKRWVYFILVNGHIAGFAMVNDYPEAPDRKTDFVLSEFFILYKYRRIGIGKQAFFQILALHKGTWQLKRHPKNLVSVSFWDSAINAYTNGKYEYIASCPGTEYEDGTAANLFFFHS